MKTLRQRAEEMIGIECVSKPEWVKLMLDILDDHEKLSNLLSDIHDELLPHQDVDDGGDGPRANYAMRIVQRINEVLP